MSDGVGGWDREVEIVIFTFSPVHTLRFQAAKLNEEEGLILRVSEGKDNDVGKLLSTYWAQ